MANISDVTVSSSAGTLLSGGTGTYTPEGSGITCSGDWAWNPSVGETYTINFSSDDSYGQPFNDCNCDSFNSSTGTATFTVEG